MPSENIDTRVIPYLTVKGADQALAFYRDVFDAQEIYRLVDPNDGRIGHAEFEIGQSRIMIADEYPDFGAESPVSIGGTPVKLVLNVADVDGVFALAVEKGASALRAVRDEFHGHRTGQVIDPFGHIWFIQTRVGSMSPAEMQAGWDASSAQSG
ncbi:MAG: VOC family protein [Sedimentitalea sp.]